ncbi:patatin-like phospholipase family protein [Permianibacter aggregans]|uniref:NTE family protein n=1 Tax=Permianibacter aggregans TaxID=1510150 RepID=A0A4R6UQ91_9GAMM|nr:patatin-like phospholipase family protein [Permianibacter aggregans]QGX40450.1 patatin [Permianibacter aggregans]TDQ49410.1 NTE family protein [Permianibacter aggregans]
MSSSSSLAGWLRAEPFTLTLGSGFFGFFAHFGVLKALLERELKPARLTGASSGALIAGSYAAGMTVSEIEQLLFSLRREDFWDPGLGLGLLKGELFRRRMRETFPCQRLEETKLPLALSVYNLNDQTTEVLEYGDLVDAVYASCALPLLFQPLKRQGVRLADGGIKDRPALAGVAENERVLIHHIASKSPWRRASDPALVPPQRPNGTTISLLGLTRVSPFRLEQGPEAFRQAYRLTSQLLDRNWSNLMPETSAK